MSRTRVAISHSRDETDAKWRIVGCLSQADLANRVTLFWDGEIAAGENWVDSLRREFASADVGIVIVSRASAKSKWVQKEYRWLRKCGAKIIPCFWEQVSKSELARFEGIDHLQRHFPTPFSELDVDGRSAYLMNLASKVYSLSVPCDFVQESSSVAVAERISNDIRQQPMLRNSNPLISLLRDFSVIADDLSGSDEIHKGARRDFVSIAIYALGLLEEKLPSARLQGHLSDLISIDKVASGDELGRRRETKRRVRTEIDIEGVKSSLSRDLPKGADQFVRDQVSLVARRLGAALEAEASLPATFPDRLRAIALEAYPLYASCEPPLAEAVRELAYFDGVYKRGERLLIRLGDRLSEFIVVAEDARAAERFGVSGPFALQRAPLSLSGCLAIVGSDPKSAKKICIPSFEDSGIPSLEHPVVDVSPQTGERLALLASEYAQERLRLPTRAEWTEACRFGSSGKFAFGDSLTREMAHVAWGGEVPGETVPCRDPRFMTTELGFIHMHGNVRELARDSIDEHGSRAEYWAMGGSYTLPPQLAAIGEETKHGSDRSLPTTGLRLLLEL